MPTKKKRVKVSAIVAAYNEERYITRCLDSLLKQTYKPIEIIVVDDGSIDNTWQVLKEFKQTNPRVRIYRKKHLEQATARNYGFKKSSGDILVFPDADYFFDKKFIEKLIQPIIQKLAIATFSRDEYIANTDNIWSQCWNINRYLPSDKRIPDDGLKRANNLRAIKRLEFQKVGGFSETGYTNDVTVLDKLKMPKGGLGVKGAICYHYNPYSLSKVFKSARRMASKGGISLNLKNLLIFSPVNSLRNGLIQSIAKRKPQYIIFKIIFDAGVIFGFFEKVILLHR